MAEIYFAGGCYWGVEKAFQMLKGVVDTEVGFANGHANHPTYEQVCMGDTGYRETVRVVYNSKRISLEELVQVFFMIIHPEQKNRQGNDYGTQYQTGIYYTDETSRQIIEPLYNEEKSKHEDFYVEFEPLRCFYAAEDEHQDYLINHPNGYCHIPLDVYAKIQATYQKE